MSRRNQSTAASQSKFHNPDPPHIAADRVDLIPRILDLLEKASLPTNDKGPRRKVQPTFILEYCNKVPVSIAG